MFFFKSKKVEAKNLTKHSEHIKDSDLVCYCFRVKKRKILDIIKNYNAKTINDIQQHSKACMGCRSCRMDLEAILNDNAN